jgi:hypothetical protein
MIEWPDGAGGHPVCPWLGRLEGPAFRCQVLRAPDKFFSDRGNPREARLNSQRFPGGSSAEGDLKRWCRIGSIAFPGKVTRATHPLRVWRQLFCLYHSPGHEFLEGRGSSVPGQIIPHAETLLSSQPDVGLHSVPFVAAFPGRRFLGDSEGGAVTFTSSGRRVFRVSAQPLLLRRHP